MRTDNEGNIVEDPAVLDMLYLQTSCSQQLVPRPDFRGKPLLMVDIDGSTYDTLRTDRSDQDAMSIICRRRGDWQLDAIFEWSICSKKQLGHWRFEPGDNILTAQESHALDEALLALQAQDPEHPSTIYVFVRGKKVPVCRPDTSSDGLAQLAIPVETDHTKDAAYFSGQLHGLWRIKLPV